ncbi:MAG: NAD(P)-dependent oxidoreductase [Chloroflexia bacterium]|nr:NAD(P)-dependent oxidoreductase [Chloroflexia bacterium]
MDVGIIGLGAMGGQMAAALVAAGHRVLAYDVSVPALERAAAAGAEAAVSCAEVGAAASVILLSLPTPAHVEAVVIGAAGILTGPADGLIVVDTSTVDPDTTRRLAATAATVGVDYLDAPVLGRPDACGNWTFPVGGDPAALDRARPILEVLGRAVVHVGPPGSGNAIKLLNNLMFGAINAITAEVMANCAAVGVSPRVFYETVASSEAATVSPLFRALGSKILEGDYAPVFTVDLMHKDVALAMAMLDEARAPLIVGSAVLSLIGLARAAGYGAEDSSAIVKVYETLLGLEVAKHA